jgi:hypothetical protein
MPSLGEAVSQLLDCLEVPAGAQGGQDPLTGPGQSGRSRIQVLVVIVAS